MSSRSAARAKGNKKESEAAAYLESLGFFCHRAVQSGFRVKCKPCPECGFKGSKWLSRSNDVFGLYDLLGEHNGPKALYVQVTHATGASARRRKILEHAHRFNLFRTDVQLWIWHDGRPTARSLYRQEWTAEQLAQVVRRDVAHGGGVADLLTDEYEFKKLGYIDIPRQPATGKRGKEEPENDGETTDVHEGEAGEEEGGPDEGEAEADPFP